MKLGCLAVLLTMGGAFAAYNQLIGGTRLEDKWWIAALLALAAGMIVGNFHGLILAFRQKKASGRPRSEWQDGDLVVVSGKIQSLRSPMLSPFSGTPSCILEYEVKSAEEDTPSVAEYSGFMMSPCSVLTMQGSVNVIGFPLLAKVNALPCVEDVDYQRAGEFLNKTKFEEKLSNPITLLKQLNEVLAKNDGEMQAHFSTSKSPLDIENQDATGIATQLREYGINLEETIIPNGAEVTVSGTYRSNRQAVEIGGGLSNLSHTLELGAASKVTGANIRNCLIWLVVVGAAFGAGNYFLLKELGLLAKFGMQ
jgi:hypothetical protein